ncbi:MAG: hypothetical protein KF760_21205 [Candidatus Eremiobacteraeota bacterium]|nr:hypothetical protein [Candidatus Eremiobacteraeota bacterium]MCW5867285.1 hypothetical protein [Candidatus Eremiobacteraeota bacterium]
MTLIELMVWSTLAFLVLAMLTVMMIQVMHYARVESERSHSFMAEMRALNWLSQDLRYANSAALVIHQHDLQPTWVSIQVSNPITPSEQPRFGDQLVYYRWKPSDGLLYRCVARPPALTLDPIDPYRPTEPELQSLDTDPRVERHQLADFVTSFKVLGPPRVSGWVRIQLETTSPNKKQTFRQERLLSVRFSN